MRKVGVFLVRKAQHGPISFIILIRTFDKQPSGLNSSILVLCKLWGRTGSVRSQRGGTGDTAALLSEMPGLLSCSFCVFQQASPPQIQMKTGQPKGRESTWLSPVACEELLRAGAQQQGQLRWVSPDPGSRSALWSPSHPCSKGHSGFTVSLFPKCLWKLWLPT